MSKLDHDASGRYIDPFAFLPRKTNIGRQIVPKEQIKAKPAVKAIPEPDTPPALAKPAATGKRPPGYWAEQKRKKRAERKGNPPAQ